MTTLSFSSFAVTCALIVCAGSAFAEPRVGNPIPAFTASDLHGHAHGSAELGTARTLVVVCTSPDARDRTDSWVRTARARLAPEGVRVVTVVALDLPFFVSEDVVRGRAQPNVPASLWGDTWIDIRGSLQRTLGVQNGSNTPYVFAVDAQHRVLASVHAPAESASAIPIWSSLTATRP